MPTKFNGQLPTCPESIEAVMKVLSQNNELMVKDIARLGRLTQSQVRRAKEAPQDSLSYVKAKLTPLNSTNASFA
jgi:hypothetical protein